jgi:anthranilate synthase component 2
MLLLIDNYDSFTWNLVHYLGELGADVVVKRNDALQVQDVIAMAPEVIVLSPGPCDPAAAGICLPLTKAAACVGIPLLGVCLGHQTIGEAFGGKVVRCHEIVHGKMGTMHHSGKASFVACPPLPGDAVSFPGRRKAKPFRPIWKSPPGWKTARSWGCGTAST